MGDLKRIVARFLGPHRAEAAFAGIDPLAIADIRQVIRYLAGQGIGVLITDHNVRETLDIIDHASIISGGAVLFEGKAEDVVRDPEVRRVYLGDMYG